MSDRLMRRRDVEEITGLSHSSIYRKMGEGTFPQSVRVTSRSVRWRSSDIDDWMESLPVTGGGPTGDGTSGEDDRQPLRRRSGSSSIDDLRRLSTASPKKRKRFPTARGGRRTAVRREPRAGGGRTP